MPVALESVLEVVIYVLMGAVVVVLVLGLGSMYSGGKNSRSNLFMRWRVGLQFAAIAVLAILIFVVKK